MPVAVANKTSHQHKNSVKTRVSRNYPEFKYHTYVPSYGAEGLPVLVAVHGISHRAKEQVRAFRYFAERYGFVVIAPLFCRKNFPAYQRLGVSKQTVPCYSDVALNTLLDEVTEETGAITEKVYLFGYSAGGQFVHRYAMAYPHRAHAVVTGAAGWYTFPDINQPFPRGLGNNSKTRPINFNLSQFLTIPMAAIVGEKDNNPNEAAFKRKIQLDLQQGVTRLERAEHWITAMQQAAALYGYDTQYKKIILASCGHSFTECVDKGQLAFRAIKFLFETTRHQRTNKTTLHSLPDPHEKYRVA